VHAIGKGTLLAEIQQTSDITYRIYDYDRKDEKGNLRELHTDLALNAIDFRFHEHYKTQYEKGTSSPIVDCKYFTTKLVEFDRSLMKQFSGLDSFVIYICTEGNSELNIRVK
ncbi:MAG: mannose-6-phosphate isomerase, partial [Bacteroidales bacterium]|nr:mannose-6-phosphate isomerase [Bacteroidales bacterium]